MDREMGSSSYVGLGVKGGWWVCRKNMSFWKESFF